MARKPSSDGLWPTEGSVTTFTGSSVPKTPAAAEKALASAFADLQAGRLSDNEYTMLKAQCQQACCEGTDD